MSPFIAVQACQPELEADMATFRLNLQDIYQCMVTKVLDKATVSIFTLTLIRLGGGSGSPPGQLTVRHF